jgi:hypothetical protein
MKDVSKGNNSLSGKYGKREEMDENDLSVRCHTRVVKYKIPEETASVVAST